MIRFKSIRSRIFTTLSVVIVMFTLAIFTYLLLHLKEGSYRSFDSVTQTINNALVANISGYVYNKDTKSMQYVIDSIKSEYVEDILILDVEGKVITSQLKGEAVGSRYAYFEALRDSSDHTLKNETRHMMLNTFELLSVPLGYLVVQGDVNLYVKEFNAQVAQLVVWMLALFFIAMGLAYYLSVKISQPLRSIVASLQGVEETEVLHLKKESEEEFSYLIQTIESKHNALLHLNTQLEDEVNKKTAQLQQLNETLEHKVATAVEDVKSKEQMLQQQARLAQMGEMISMIAHQWRQPLAAITSAMMVIDRYIETDKFNLGTHEGRAALQTFLEEKHEGINNNIQYLSTTTDDFRNFFNPHTEKVSTLVHVPVEKALQLIQTSMQNKGISVMTDFQSTHVCELYQNEVIQVILNILKNASDALLECEKEEKKLKVLTYEYDRETIIEICDNGPGIPKPIYEHIFDPYFSTKGEKVGTGLGLYMSKTIIEEHNGGKIEVKTSPEGTCFVLRFARSLL